MQIQTERLFLRDFVREDWEQVHRYASDPGVTAFMIWGPNTIDETKAYMEYVIRMQEQQERTGFELAVVLRDTNQLIGGCGIHIEGRNAEMGYCFNPEYWGHGYATEAAQALVTFGFKEKGVHRIYATCRPGNSSSANVMRRLGMQQEGHLREHMYHKGQYHDSYLFSILATEVEEQQQ